MWFSNMFKKEPEEVDPGILEVKIRFNFKNGDDLIEQKRRLIDYFAGEKILTMRYQFRSGNREGYFPGYDDLFG